MEARSEYMPNVYASIGEQLVHYQLDIIGGELVRGGSVKAPANVQYAWPHPARGYLYVASSDRVRGELGTSHHLTTFRIADTGALEQVGASLPIPYRPIHITVDGAGQYLAATFNNAGTKHGPGTVLVYRIVDDGAALEPPSSSSIIEAGMYPHQARFTPDDQGLLVCARGNKATAQRAEDLGSLRLFQVRSAGLSATAEAPYASGLGPRHLDIHPSEPWLYVSMERGNRLCVHRLDGGAGLTPPIFSKTTLADEARGKRPRQLAGPIHVHPNGTHVYVANRADGVVLEGETDLFEGGENSIAVYRIDQSTGDPSIDQHADTHGVSARTFAIDPTGRVLVVGNQLSRPARDGKGGVTTIPISLALFRIAPDGRLDFIRKYDQDVGKKSLFWMGIV